MDAKKCDRCGQFYLPQDKPFSYPLIFMNQKAYHERIGVDLCPKCLLEVKQYIKDSKDSDNQ